MRLHLPKALLAAVLAACLAWPAGAFTSTTTNYPTGSSTPTIFNGDIWTWGNGNGNALGSKDSSFTKYGEATVTYQGNDTITGPGSFWGYFFNSNALGSDYVGNTLRFEGATSDMHLKTDYTSYAWIGGIIVEGGNNGTYKLGRDGTNTNFKLNGVGNVNMIINSNFKFLTTASSSVAVEKGGTWSIAKGKSLTFDTGTTAIAANQTVNVTASGTEGTATLEFTGNINNSGTLTIGSGVNMTVAASKTLNSTTIANNGTITLASGAIIVLDQLLATSNFTTEATTTGAHTATNGAFTFATGDGTVSVGDTLSCTYNGVTANVTWNDGHKTGTASVPYYFIAENGTATYADASADTPAWITVSAGATLSDLPNDADNSRTSNVGINIKGSGTLSMSTTTGQQQVTINAGRLEEFTGSLLIEKGRFNERDGDHVFSNVTVQDGGQFFIEESCTYNGNVSIAGTGWNGSSDAAAAGALRLGNGAVLSGTLTLASDANVRVHAGGIGKIANSANWTNKVTKVGGGELWLTGSVNIGDVDVSAGTFSLGKLEGPKVASQQIAVGNVSVANGGTFAVGYSKGTVASVTLAANATLRYYDNVSETEITNASDTTNITSLRVNAAANLRADWKGTLNISELTGAGNLALSKTENAYSPHFYLNISSIKDYSGTITGPTSNVSLMTVTIGGANISDAASTATVSADVTLKAGFTKTGAGAVSFGGTTNATDVTVSSGSLTFAGGTSISKLSLNGGATTISGATTVSGVKENGIIAKDNTIKLTISDKGTLTHDGFKYTGTELSGLSHGLTMWNANNEHRTETYNVTVSGGTLTQTAAGEKGIYAALKNVKLINGSGTTSTLGVNADLSGANIGGTLSINEATTTTIKNTFTDSTGATGSSIATLTGSGTLKATGGTTEVTNATGFSGTLAATGGNIELQSAAALALSEVVVSGGSSITVVDTVSDVLSISASKVSIGKGAAGSLVGNLSIQNGGTITLDASDGATTETGGTKGLSLSALTTTLADEGSTSTTGSLTLGSGLTLTLLNLGKLTTGDSLTLFSGVTSAVYGDAATELTADGIEAKNVFSNLTEGDFKLSFDETNHIVALVTQRDVPEPTTATLSLLALMGLAARRRRRKA